MKNQQQLCSKQGHKGCKLTHICIERHSANRYMCNQCVDEYQYGDYSEYWDSYHFLYYIKNYNIRIDHFTLYFKDQRLPQIELRLKSQNGNQAKLKYLKKVYDTDFGDLGGFNDELKNQKDLLKEIKNMIQDLIDEYEREIEEAQSLYEINQQFTLNGLQSLNTQQLDILLDDQCKFINREMEYYNYMNKKLNDFVQKKNQIEEKKFYLEYQKLRKIQKDLRKINDYLDFQKYSTDGKEFEFYHAYYQNSSFFSRNDRYYAMIHQQYYIYLSQLKIRQQNTLNVTQKLNVRDPWRIRFDTLFNYCIIQFKENSDFFSYYNLKNKQFKLIRKFKRKSYVRKFYLSNLNNIIIVFNDSIVIKALNSKNELINKIKLKKIDFYEQEEQDEQEEYDEYQEYEKQEEPLFSYGSERNIIAVHFKKQVKIYQETQQQPFLCQLLDTQFKKMKLVNNDSQLLTQYLHYEIYWMLWQIDYSNQKITLINKIKTNRDYSPQEIYINQSEYNIIKLSGKWFRNKQSVQLTKHLLLSENQVIKRRAIIDYEKLQYD